MLSGGFENAPTQSAQAFRVVLDVMARPGQIKPISGGSGPGPLSEAAATVLLTLCDAETSIYLSPDYDTPEVAQWIAFHLGAPLVGPQDAMFALGTWAELSTQSFPIGTAEYPDRSTTLIVECESLAAKGARLTGPGIKTEAHLSLPEGLTRSTALFPLGTDYIFTAGDQVAALPRSTKVEAA